MYNNYEEYMQSVLGYNTFNNTYRGNEEYYYDSIRTNPNLQEMKEFYPEIYGIVYPVIQKVCSKANSYNISKERINQMVDEVYDVIEPREETEETREANKNGDVKNPRAKETKKTTTDNNLLKDLIRILILRELLSESKPGVPPRPMPPMPPMQGGACCSNGMPPIFGPGNPRMY